MRNSRTTRVLAAAAVTSIAVALLAAPAAADETYLCWTPRPSVVVCRISGSTIVTFRGEETVPTRLHAAMGSDSLGECWFLRSTFTGWRFRSRAGGSAVIQWVGLDGSTAIILGMARACVGEPRDPEIPPELWEILRRFRYSDPDPGLNPSTGLTGLATYVATPVPAEFRREVAGELGSIEVEFLVSAVAVDWGDGSVVALAAPEFGGIRTGWPDGSVFHEYETSGRYLLTVTYLWLVRWRVDGGPWSPLDVGPTVAVIDYPVDELVGRRIA